MKAKNLGFAERADHTVVVAAEERVRGVENQFQTVLVRDRLQLFDVTGSTPEMGGEDSSGAGGDHPPHGVGIERMRCGIDVGKNRRNALPRQSVRRCNEGI